MTRSLRSPLLNLCLPWLLAACTGTPVTPEGRDLAAPASVDQSVPADMATPDLLSLPDLLPVCAFGQVSRNAMCTCFASDDVVCGGGYCCSSAQQCLPGVAGDPVRCSAAPPRLRPAFAYDANRKTSLVFGGVESDGAPPLVPAYELGPVTWSQVRGAGAVNPPAARFGASLVYDELNKRLLLFGGQVNDAVYFNDLWAWDGSTWSRVAAKGTPPTPRALTAMAFDSARNIVVLFGGDNKPAANMGSYAVNDTWELNVTSDTWTQRNDGTVGMNSRAVIGHAMAYDAKNKRTVLFGGNFAGVGPFVYSQETWIWNGTAWTQQGGAAPNPRAYYGMAYDSARGVIVISGGETNAGLFQALGDVWELDNLTWTKRNPATNVPGRSNHSMTYDANRKLVLTFGGLQNDLQDASNQLWGWNGTTWARLY